MNEQNPYVQITNQATKEALLAQRKHAIEAQRSRVENLTEQVDDRVAALSSLASRVRMDPTGFHGGAFGHDTETIDDLLRALAAEAEALANIEAAERETDRLTVKYEAMMQSHEQHEHPREPIPMGAGHGHGQYL